jgi:clan AA aspartic protease (TIGR02281 family)
MLRELDSTFLLALAAIVGIGVVGCSKGTPRAAKAAVTAAVVQPPPASATPVAIPAVVRGNAVETEVPLEDDGGTFVVPVTVNDTISLKFTIDSGAADVSIPADVASTLVRSGTITQEDFIGGKTFVLADGSTVPSAEFRIRTLKVGTLVLHNITASLADPKGSLLLGQSFLARLSSWSMDNARHVLMLKAAPGEAEAVARDQSIVGPESVQQSAGSTVSGGARVSAGMDEATATQLAIAYLSAWSDPRDPDGIRIRSFYADTVNFYGHATPVDELMKQKLAFARRWPSRTYVVRANSLAAQCADGHTCTVTGVLDWQASNDVANRRSTGMANFSMAFRDGLIAAESGSVLARQ